MTKETYLHDKHIQLGARMVDFAGWHMPVQYTSIIEEHKTVRENVGLFDVSHMGEVFVSGKDSLAFLQKIVPQDISKLAYEKAVYCQLPNKKGGLIDDLIIYKLGINYYLVICNAARIDEDLNWMVRNKKGLDVKIDNQSHNYSLLAVQGPKADSLLRTMGLDTQQESFTIKPATICGRKLLISRTGYTGEDGYELLVENEYSEELWDKILDYGKEFGIKPIGLGARDTLRLEAALHLYGNDLDENTTPIEAGLSWSVPKDKKEDYNGKDVIMNQIANGTDKKLIGLKMLDKGIARHEYEVYKDGEKIGVITSGGVSPVLNTNIALAYVKNDKDICTGSVVQVMIREKLHNAEVVKRPFIDKRNKIKIK
ncbi:TPA: glycine cleavage system aminomethyltransferase GcvT [Candidatus Scatousia excrementigallinarum]|uniref:Aminomethyltransferase n=1 Tax=Candidatus Scatousia excrementigallinarum TaxID=2840935 RepID=A0A9D1JMV4_9BACT|nr:glycine cleavage system aminomethyltransferase GcvT [Candidatus Scatousia excrementigallinarum]